MPTIEQMIDGVVAREGGFTQNPNDSGGATMYGISSATARRNGYTGAMSQMPRATALAIYKTEYFANPKFDLIYAVSQPIAEEMFDTGVNMGVSVPAQWLQRCLNALGRQHQDYAQIATDGQIGPATVAALRAYLALRGADGEKIILRLLNCLQGVRYLEISESRPANQTFLNGWLLNRVEIAA